MSVSLSFFLAAVLLSALIVVFLRSVAFLLFRGDRSMPMWMQRLGDLLPAAITAVLIVYCLRGGKSDLIGTGVPGIIAVLATGLSYKWKHNTFISIILGTAVYMALIRVMPLL